MTLRKITEQCVDLKFCVAEECFQIKLYKHEEKLKIFFKNIAQVYYFIVYENNGRFPCELILTLDEYCGKKQIY